MKKATLDANAIYWDMYKAMGGKNSMPSWVFADPPLCSKDFVHFNARGAKIIANMFYNA
jgi:lysophospholipase L1-like esterase